MKNHLFFDTETTGIPKGGHDARIVQLAALLTDNTGAEKARMNVIVKPDGWVIPKEASDIHGISTEHAMRQGLPIAMVIDKFHDLAEHAEVFVAHNMPFDHGRYIREAVNGLGLLDATFGKQGHCTMTQAHDLVKCPPTDMMIKWGRGNQFKKPNLQECHVHFFGEKFDGAHDALADVIACKDIFFAMNPQGV